jgi:protein involved in polysaccharide export with SLBB domain
MRRVYGWEVGKIIGIAIVVIFVLIPALGCQAARPAKTPLEMSTEIASGPEPKLILGPGDVLDFKFFYNPELNDSQTVRFDGRISLQLIGEVMAQGKAPMELQEEISKLYTSQLRRPETTVVVRSLANRRVYVGGFVRTPGLIEMRTRMTALEAIMQAGGFDMWRAEIKNVVIIRHKDNQRYGCALDFSGELEGKATQPFYLEPLDIVYVPRTTISRVNLWIDQYINQILPKTGFTYLAPLGSGATIGIQPSTTVYTQP